MRVRLRSSIPGTVSEGWRSRVRHGVGVPGMVIWGWMMRVRLDVDVPACYDWVSSEEGETSETGRSAELAFVQRDWS